MNLQRSSCLCLSTAGIKGVYNHTLQIYSNFLVNGSEHLLKVIFKIKWLFLNVNAGAQGGQQRASDPLDLELGGHKLPVTGWSSWRAVWCTLSHWAISPAVTLNILKHAKGSDDTTELIAIPLNHYRFFFLAAILGISYIKRCLCTKSQNNICYHLVHNLMSPFGSKKTP